MEEDRSKTELVALPDQTVQVFGFGPFRIEVIDNGNGTVSPWLYHKEYCVKEMLYTIKNEDINSEEDLKSIIQENLWSFIEAYRGEYMKD